MAESVMTKRERVRAAVYGAEVDRLPFCFWHHFRPQGSARRMIDATLDFFGRFDLDIYKLMPDLPYPFPRTSIGSPDTWTLLTPLDVGVGNPGRQLETVRELRTQLGPDVPLIVTLFSPYAEALHFAGAELLHQHMQEAPIVLHGALDIISGNLADLGVALLEAGADGIYFAVQGAETAQLSTTEYAEFARPYDLRVLHACASGWLNVLHVHGATDLRLDEFLAYPVPVISWSDRLTGIPLTHVRQAAPDKAVMGGLHEFGAITSGPIDTIRDEMRDALAQTGGIRHILAPGCSVPDDCPEQWLRVARELINDVHADR